MFLKGLPGVVLTILLASIPLVACGGAESENEPSIATPEAAGSTQSIPEAEGSTRLEPESTSTAEPKTPAEPTQDALSTEALLAESLTWLVSDIDAMQSIFGEGTEAMVESQISAGSTSNLPFWLPGTDGGGESFGVSWNPRGLSLQKSAVAGVPTGFIEPLSSTGQIDAPPGACPAGAKPTVAFSTAGGDTVTSELLSSKNLKTLSSDYFVRLPGVQSPEEDLVQRMAAMVANANDPRLLATPEGWDEVLWEQMKDLQEPARSLMDYQIWTVSPGIEAAVMAGFRQTINSMGLPPFVIDAFENSNSSGWIANSTPTESDMLAKMDIEAELAGSLEGTVYETREISVPTPGAKPVFGTQTGYGSVAYNHPTEGKIPFEVEIALYEYDELGRAIDGTVTGTSEERGYDFEVRFRSDGTKEGDLIRDGIKVGELTMSVDAEQFHNYLNVETNQEERLAKPNYWNAE